MELDRSSAIDRMQSKVVSIDEFNFDRLVAPPLYSLLSQQDIDNLYHIATSIKYSGNARKKYKAIDDIMKPRGFVKLSAGTNRVVYRFLEDDRFVVKVAADAVGIKDNPREFMNQQIFKPFVTKVFEVSPCGTVGVFERINPITSREEFMSVAEDIYEVITQWFIGEYIMADIGTKFFMNWGIRASFGPVLLDFPYCYELDGNKLYCSAPNDKSETGRCDGVIDYDDGFNFLVCQKCGVRYRVNELAKSIKDETIIVKGRRTKRMRVVARRNNVTISQAEDNIDKMFNQPTAKIQKSVVGKPVGTLKVSAERKEKPTKKENSSQRDNSSDYRMNPKNGNNRGIVRASGTSNLRVNGKKEESSDNFNGVKKITITPEFDHFDSNTGVASYSHTFKDKQYTINIDIASIPAELLENTESFLAVANELEDAKMDISLLEKKVEESAKAYSALYESTEQQKESECQCKDIKDENERLKAEIIKLNEAYDEAKEKLKELDNVEKANDTLSEDISKISTEAEELKKANIDLKKENSKLEKASKKSEEKLAEKDKEIEELKSKLSQIENPEENANILCKLDAVTEALSTANRYLDNSIQLSVDEMNYDTENGDQLLGNYNNLQLICGKLVPISSVSDGPVDKDINVIVFPSDDDSYCTDQDGNIITVISINDHEIIGLGTGVFVGDESDEEKENE